MPSFTQAIADFVNSILSLIGGVFHTVFGAVQTIANAVISLFMNLFNMAEGIVGFVIGNLFILVVIAAVIFGYRAYAGQKRAGGNKKLL